MISLTGAYSIGNNQLGQNIQNVFDNFPQTAQQKSQGRLSNRFLLTQVPISGSIDATNQIYIDPNKQWQVSFSGEMYNLKDLNTDLKNKGVVCKTENPAEVVLELYKIYGKQFLNQLNGSWAIAIYDIINDQLLVTRDRYGVQPIYYYLGHDHLFFASSIKSLTHFPFKKHLDKEALQLYFQLNYIPGPLSIFSEIKKLLPGYLLFIDKGTVNFEQYYKIPYDKDKESPISNDYEAQKKKLVKLLAESVRLRMESTSSLGAFLSGGIDSSVVVSQAVKFTDQLDTFSIGFEGNDYFDETPFARIVSNKYKTNHTVFNLSNNDLFEGLQDVLDCIDEPFADSSALLVNILTEKTQKHLSVALSGDAGDELFAGYNKHYGEYILRKGGFKTEVVSLLGPVWKMMPKSRHGKVGNLFRQLERFAIGTKLTQKERYWRWCCFLDESTVKKLLNNPYHADPQLLEEVKHTFLQHFSENGDMNEVLLADVKLVLPYDMLTKVYSMSSKNSLQVRVPFLDHKIVEYAFSLPVSSKIDDHLKKKLIQDAFREELPKELYNRPKKGFEVPLLQWFRTQLKEDILNKYLNSSTIKEAGILNEEFIESVKNKLFSNNPEDIHAVVWALIVFQSWLEKNKNHIDF